MSNLYADIARRTGGDIYIGVVGPVRTGKSTLIKRIMEELVIPNIEDLYQRERARDELPQSGSGRTIMTAEPKFVPEEAVEITPDGTARLSVRLIDSVGYLVDGAIGATENGQPRMVTTPWADTELPMEEAAELGTRKVMEEHSTVGLVVTTDGSITDIPRADYREAEARAIRDMQATGKPFLVVVNSAAPNGGQAQALRCELEETYGVHAVTADCQSLHEAELGELLRALLYTFPMREVRVFLPAWVRALELEHPLKAALYSALRENEYVNMTFTPGGSNADGKSLYLQNPFLRQESGRSYIYVQGEDGRLEKRYVTTGKSLWGSYTEIRSGLTAEEYIAFPYGKSVQEGAATRTATVDELYNSYY